MLDKVEAVRYFCIAAETLHFREAANRLAISPQVVTRMIAELEQQLGEPLFKRNTRNISLTDFGKAFLADAQMWLKATETLFQTDFKESLRGTVRITLPRLPNNDLILAELLEALADHPQLHIDWRLDTALYNSVTKQIDIGIRISMQMEPHFIAREICTIKERIVVSPKLLAKLGRPQDLNDLQTRFPLCVEINPQTGKAWHWFNTPTQSFIVKDPYFMSSESYSNLAVVLQGLAVGMLPEYHYASHTKAGRLTILFPELAIPDWKLFIYRPQQENTPIRVLHVFNLLSEILQKHYGKAD
ncbi:LysR family transcriptional regulator [Actinobacillus pleuropneumoniae]|uniref:LysR family transcriptional regulator n=1 Tax=Actinobacillus pleuropneumoniae TaxID=715 RepID=UPI003B02B22C